MSLDQMVKEMDILDALLAAIDMCVHATGEIHITTNDGDNFTFTDMDSYKSFTFDQGNATNVILATRAGGVTVEMCCPPDHTTYYYGENWNLIAVMRSPYNDLPF